MTGSHYTLSRMSAQELALAIDWAAQEGWNPGLQDAVCFQAADPQGFFIGKLDGEPAAVISAVRYDQRFGFIGLYIVRPELRGQGYGIQLWNHGLAYLRGCTVGLDGVVEQQDNYRRSGFVFAHRSIRFSGRAEALSVVTDAIVPLAQREPAPLLAYDRGIFPAPRAAFIACWIDQPGATALACVEQGQLCGYGVIRPCRAGYKIGPLAADAPAQADALFRALIARLPAGTEYFLDIPEPNREAVALARRYRLAPVFETARMYAGAQPELPLQRLYGITSFELG